MSEGVLEAIHIGLRMLSFVNVVIAIAICAGFGLTLGVWLAMKSMRWTVNVTMNRGGVAMSADIIARLRAGGKDSIDDVMLMRDAANEIERLREALKGATVVVNRAAEVERENERLRAALAPFATEALEAANV